MMHQSQAIPNYNAPLWVQSDDKLSHSHM